MCGTPINSFGTELYITKILQAEIALLFCTKNDYLAERTSIHQETMMLNGYPKSFIEKEIKKTLKKMENTPHNSNKEKTERIAKLFLPQERGYEEKSKRIAKKHGIEVIFTRRQTLKQKLLIPRGKKLEKQGVVYIVRCKSKRCKMEYIGETGKQKKDYRIMRLQKISDQVW